MATLLRQHAHVIVSWTVENQVDFYDRFDRVVLMSAPWEELLERVTTPPGERRHSRTRSGSS